MLHRFQACVVGVLLIYSCSLTLNAQFTVSGEIRPRAELRHGFKALAQQNQDAAFFIDQRSRINLGFSSNEIETFISFQDVRVWGNTVQLVADAGALTSVHQAWANIRFKKYWGLKLGRQELSYDDHRILGNVGWAQQARSHDAALLTFKDSSFQAHFCVAFNQESPRLISTIYTLPNYKTLQFIWLRKVWAQTQLSFLLLNNGVQLIRSTEDFETKFSQTIGGRLSWQSNQTKINFATYYQTGRQANELESKINAYYLSFDITYSLSPKFSLVGGTEILSGNDFQNPDNENNAFNPFYGTNHKFNGLMDYFFVGNHINNVGLNDFFVKGNYQNKGLTAGLALHFFITNDNLPELGGEPPESYLGTEIDYTMAFPITKGAKISLGYSQMFGTDSMVQISGGDTNAFSNWVWAMVTIKPSYTFKKN